MTDDFVNDENAHILQSMTEKVFQDFIARWKENVPKNPVVFEDGTMYGDCGREIERRMFWLFHKDDTTMCRCEGAVR